MGLRARLCRPPKDLLVLRRLSTQWEWKAYRTTGFGIVVTSTEGDHIGYGKGVPPGWCATAAAAEAWALRTVLSAAPFPPQMRTDCMSPLTTAKAGGSKATDPRRALARIWCHIVATIDGRLEQLANNDVLVCLPPSPPVPCLSRRSQALERSQAVPG